MEARARKAQLYEGVDDFAGAEAALREALTVAPEDDELLQVLGRLEAEAGREKEAVVTLREALRINPKLTSVERYVEFLDPAAAGPLIPAARLLADLSQILRLSQDTALDPTAAPEGL